MLINCLCCIFPFVILLLHLVKIYFIANFTVRSFADTEMLLRLYGVLCVSTGRFRFICSQLLLPCIPVKQAIVFGGVHPYVCVCES